MAVNRSAPIAPHPFGGVFAASVGIRDAPVGDDWDARQRKHIWLAQRWVQISRGNHLFVLGAGRRSAVLGLYEVTSSGTSRQPRNPWDPDRWPWAVAVRPLASVPTFEARAVRGLTALRGTANLIRDEERRAALYAAVAGYEVGPPHSGRTASSEPQHDDHRARETRTRPFDPAHVPASAAGAAQADPERTQILQEKARANHHAILVALHRSLSRRAWRNIEEIPAAFDMRARRPDGLPVIFEAKTISAMSESAQCRSALAQLLEYRLEHGGDDNSICVVVDHRVSDRRASLLDRLVRDCLSCTTARSRLSTASANRSSQQGVVRLPS